MWEDGGLSSSCFTWVWGAVAYRSISLTLTPSVRLMTARLETRDVATGNEMPTLRSSPFPSRAAESSPSIHLQFHQLPINFLNLPFLFFFLSIPSQIVPIMARDDYTDPELHDQIKEDVQKGSKGGPAGKWTPNKVIISKNPSLL